MKRIYGRILDKDLDFDVKLNREFDNITLNALDKIKFENSISASDKGNIGEIKVIKNGGLTKLYIKCDDGWYFIQLTKLV